MVSVPNFTVHTRRTGAVQVLTPVGELDLATAPLLDSAFQAALEDAAVETIFLDLTELSFIDLSAVTLLISFSDSCRADDRLRIINGSDAVARVLDLSGVRHRLPIFSGEWPPAPEPN